MVCPKCRTEYIEDVFECADCRVALVNEITVSPAPAQSAEIPAGAALKKVFETGDSYAFLDAAEALRQADIPFIGDEFCTGDLRVGRRDEAPYAWTLMVPEERAGEALSMACWERR